MHTIIRNRETDSTDFEFYADRLLRLVGLACLAEAGDLLGKEGNLSWALRGPGVDAQQGACVGPP